MVKHKKQPSGGVILRKDVLKHFAKFANWSLLLIKFQAGYVNFLEVTVLGACNFMKEDSGTGHRVLPVKFAHFLKAIILKNICECLFLNFI